VLTWAQILITAEMKTRAIPSSPQVSQRMRRVRQANTSAEVALKKQLAALGLRCRTQVPVLAKPRRVADISFPRLRLAVFVDGCFWHCCPKHHSWPKRNARFWRNKIVANVERDQDTNARLRAKGWVVLRIWAHENPTKAASRIARIALRRKGRLR
jgi:DNA mismatch endonuclease (patch repair protein)